MGLQDIAGDLFRSIYNAAAPTRQPDFEGPNPGGLPMGTPPIVDTPSSPLANYSYTGAAPDIIGEPSTTTFPTHAPTTHPSMIGSVLDAVLGLRSMGLQRGDIFNGGFTGRDSANPSTVAPPVTGGVGQPYFDTSGGNWKNDLAKTGVAALLQLIPPMLAGRNHRRQVGAAWSQAFAPMMVQGIGNLVGGRADHDAAVRAAVLGGMIQRGDVTFTPPAPGAPPIGNMGGMPVYKAQTLQEKFPQIFKGGATGPSVTPSPTTAPNASPTWGVLQPQEPGEQPSTAMQIYGGLNATPASTAVMAKYIADQEALKRQQATNAMILGGGGLGGGTSGDMESSTTVKAGKSGGLEVSRTTKPKSESFQEKLYNSYSPAEKSQFRKNKLEGFSTPFKQWMAADDQRRKDNNLPARTPEETQGAINDWQVRGMAPLLTMQATQPAQAGIMAAKKDLNKYAAMVPQEYLPAALGSANDWDTLVSDPKVKAAIDNSQAWVMSGGFKMGSLSDAISSQLHILEENTAERQQAQDALKGSAIGAPPTPAVTAPPTMPGAGGYRPSNAAAVDAVIRHLAR